MFYLLKKQQNLSNSKIYQTTKFIDLVSSGLTRTRNLIIIFNYFKNALILCFYCFFWVLAKRAIIRLFLAFVRLFHVKHFLWVSGDCAIFCRFLFHVKQNARGGNSLLLPLAMFNVRWSNAR